MNANELMLENYVKETATNRIGTILYVDFHKTKVKLEHSTLFCPIQAIEPIPLTEKWLLDLGFKQYKLVFSLTNDEYSITIFFCDLWQFQYETPLESANLVNDFKVHELQNLYYSLTGRFLQLVMSYPRIR